MLVRDKDQRKDGVLGACTNLSSGWGLDHGHELAQAVSPYASDTLIAWGISAPSRSLLSSSIITNHLQYIDSINLASSASILHCNSFFIPPDHHFHESNISLCKDAFCIANSLTMVSASDELEASPVLFYILAYPPINWQTETVFLL